MSERSLPPPFGRTGFRLSLRNLQWPRLKGLLRRLYTRRRDAGDVRVPALKLRAEQTVHEHLETHAASFDRARRLGEKAERLEEAGTPNESARNRAERAREEVVAELAALRASFIEATGRRRGARVFERVLERRCPTFALPHVPSGRAR